MKPCTWAPGTGNRELRFRVSDFGFRIWDPEHRTGNSGTLILVPGTGNKALGHHALSTRHLALGTRHLAPGIVNECGILQFDQPDGCKVT